MVMPCSRSASRPSVSSARSSPLSGARVYFEPAMALSWSANTPLLSSSRRPIKVDLPSSTDPAVIRRSTLVSGASCHCSLSAFMMSVSWLCAAGSEVALLLAALHRGLGGLVIHAGGAALGDGGDGRLGDDVGRRGRRRGHRAGAGHVPHGPEPHAQAFGLLALARRR